MGFCGWTKWHVRRRWWLYDYVTGVSGWANELADDNSSFTGNFLQLQNIDGMFVSREIESTYSELSVRLNWLDPIWRARKVWAKQNKTTKQPNQQKNITCPPANTQVLNIYVHPIRGHILYNTVTHYMERENMYVLQHLMWCAFMCARGSYAPPNSRGICALGHSADNRCR